MPSILGVKTNKEHSASSIVTSKTTHRKKRDQGRRLVLFLFFFLFLLWAVEVEEELCSMPIQRRHAASSAGVAVPSRTRRLMTCIFASYFAFRSSFAFASSASFTFLRAASSSSILTSSRAAFARKRRVEVSTPSAAGAARAGGATDGTPAETRAAASSLSCGSAPTDSGAGRVPGRGRSCARRPSCVSRTSPSGPSRRSTTFVVVGPELWWRASARAIATLRRSWRKNCLSRRSRRLAAAPARSLMATAKVREKITQQKCVQPV